MIPGYTVARGTDTAHDPVNRVYLEVSAYGPVTGRFLNESGHPVTNPFPITPGTAFASYPRAIYSPHMNGGAGGFLVVWHQADGPIISGPWPSNVVHGRTVRYAAQPILGTDFTIGQSPTGTFQESAPAGAYSESSQQFLVAWRSVNYNIQAVRVSNTGAPVSGVFTISDASSRDPGVAWNSANDEFGVSYSGWDNQSATVTFARVRAADGAVLRRNIIHRASGTFITDIVFNPALGSFVVASASPGPRTTEVNAAGDVVSHRLTASTVGTYDGLSIALNTVSGTILLAGHYTKEIGGVELDGRGAKIGPEQQVTSGGARNGSFYPRVSGNTQAKLFHVTFARDFAAAASQILMTSSAGGSSGGGNGPTDSDADGVPDASDACPSVFAQTANGCPTGGGSGNVGSCPGAAPFPGAVCVNGGWVPGSGGSGGSGGGGCPGAAPFPGAVCVNGGWVPGSGGSGGSGGGGTGGCPGSAPFSGAVCVNGGWVPGSGGSGGGSCPGSAPFPGAVCVNGGWVPGSGGSGGSNGACSTASPGAGWTCVNGGWLPPGMAAAELVPVGMWTSTSHERAGTPALHRASRAFPPRQEGRG